MLPASFHTLTGHLCIFGEMYIWISATSKVSFFFIVFLLFSFCVHVSTHILLHCSVIHVLHVWVPCYTLAKRGQSPGLNSNPGRSLEPAVAPGEWVDEAPGVLTWSLCFPPRPAEAPTSLGYLCVEARGGLGGLSCGTQSELTSRNSGIIWNPSLSLSWAPRLAPLLLLWWGRWEVCTVAFKPRWLQLRKGWCPSASGERPDTLTCSCRNCQKYWCPRSTQPSPYAQRTSLASAAAKWPRTQL